MREAIDDFRKLGRRDFLAMALNNLAQFLLIQGNPFYD